MIIKAMAAHEKMVLSIDQPIAKEIMPRIRKMVDKLRLLYFNFYPLWIHWVDFGVETRIFKQVCSLALQRHVKEG